jgi:uncharacterized protein YegL
MKQFVTWLFLLFFFTTVQQSFGQGSLSYSLTVVGQGQKPVSNLSIVLIETSTFERKVFKTNASGQLKFTLDSGKEWVMNVGAMKNHDILKIRSGTSTGSQMVTYDVARWNRINEPPVDRTKINLDFEHQKISSTEQASASHIIFELLIEGENGRGWPKIPVQLTSYRLNKAFVATTDGSGIARFRVPIKQNYQIDVDGEENFSYFDIGDKSGRSRITIRYNKINFKEEVNQDGFIEQTFLQDPEPVSNRVMVTLFVMGGPNNGKNEEVYLDMSYSNKVFKGKTNEDGKVIFMLPKKNSYKISFNFQKDAGGIDLTRFWGIGSMSTGALYTPDPRLQHPENYLPSNTDLKEFDLSQFVTETYPRTDDHYLVNVHARWGNEKINSGSQEALLELGFSVKQPKARKPTFKQLNMAFVLDKSGSMLGERLDLLKSAMLEFIAKLRPTDKITLIFFDSQAVAAYELPTMNKPLLEDMINALQANGGTNIYAGLQLGYEKVEKNQSENTIDRLVLLTDGYGSTPVDEILEQSKKYFNKGIAVSTIGVGVGYNHSLLSLISQFSGGMDHQALESEGIPTALNNEFESLMYPLATDMKVKVKYNNKIIYKTLFGLPEKTTSDGFVKFELGRVYSSMNQMVLMKFKLDNPTKEIADHAISIHVTYFDEYLKQDVEIIKKVNLEWTDETNTELIIEDKMKKIYSIAVINQSMKVIADFCEATNYAKAKDEIRKTIKSLKRINGEKFSDDLIPLVKQLKEYLISLDLAIKNKG